MPASILVATPHAAFGELLRLSLEEQGQYQVRLESNASEARASLKRHLFQLVIVDHDQPDEPFAPFTYEIMAQYPGTRVVIIPPENNPNHPTLGGLIPHGYLNQPFYLPDLLEMTARLLQEAHLPPQKALPDPDAHASAWLEDTMLLQGYLEKQLASSEASAALVGQDGQLRANAGSLPLAAAQEMAALLLRYWDRDEKTDLMRYIRLTAVKGDFLTYVTEIRDGFVLIMAYEPGVAISQVRPHTRMVAQVMATTPPPGFKAPGSPATLAQPGVGPSKNGSGAGTVSSYPSPAPAARSAALETQTEPLENGMSPARHGATQPPAALPDHPEGADLSSEEEAEIRSIDLSLLLGAVPSPDPGSEEVGSTFGPPASSLGWVRETNLWESSPLGPEFSPYVTDLTAGGADDPGSDGSLASPASDDSQTIFLQAPAPGSARPGAIQLLGPEPEIDPLSDTQPRVLHTVSHLSQLEPVSPALSLLNYTCVLVPRLPHHYLTGDLADRLAQWVQQFCLAFGWRLEGIAIRPEYLQWTVQVAPSVSPGNLVRILRQRTSTSIFDTYEPLKAQNPSGDFWAVGYLIVSGSQPPSAQLLRDYIQQTRKRQGVSKP